MKSENSKAKGVMVIPELVRAIIKNQKTQTRRLMKGVKIEEVSPGVFNYEIKGKGSGLNVSFKDLQDPFLGVTDYAPLGKVGDRIYVRETFRELTECSTGEFHSYCYYADMPEEFHKVYPSKWKPSIHMPKKAARIFLEITNVRVERLNDISEDDAIAEGICVDDEGLQCWDYLDKSMTAGHPITSFETLWESLSGPGSWEENPWVWVYDFKRVDGIEYDEVHGMLLEKQKLPLVPDITFPNIMTEDKQQELRDSFTDNIVEEMLSLEDQVLRKVAAQCLGREFLPEDAHMFTIVTHQDWEDKYQLNYLNIPIGMIQRNLGHESIEAAWNEKQPKFGVTFTPFALKPDCEVCAETVDEVYHCERCERLICNKCQAGYNQFSQIDFNCCKSCAEQNPD